jgi:glycosyltransferase involved in cell wall biosynthesis
MKVEVATVQSGGDLTQGFAGVPVRCAGRRRGRTGAAALARLWRFARDFDVVHTHLWAGDAYGRPAAALAGVPVRVSTEHNIDRDEPPWKHRWKARSASLVHRIVAVSRPVAAHWRRMGIPAEKLVVVENGVDRARFASPWSGQGGRVLAVGRLVPQKGFDVLIAAMRHLPGLGLDVAGAGPWRATLEASAPPGVRFLGAVDDLPTRMAAAAAVVVPSRWEGFGLVAAEGMAAGVPVVASAVDGLVDVVGEAGVLVPPGDPRALAAALGALVADPARCAALSAAGRRRAERFDLDRMVRRYESLYRELAKERKDASGAA